MDKRVIEGDAKAFAEYRFGKWNDLTEDEKQQIREMCARKRADNPKDGWRG